MFSSTSTSGNSSENNEDTPATPFKVQKRDILFSSSTRYLLLDFHGEGCFGKVAKCVNLTTGEQVAVKIHKENKKSYIHKELEMLRIIRTLDPDKTNIIKFLEDFKFNDHSCMAFEMLDKSLWDLMVERMLVPFTLNEIRPVIHQLMVAFDALKSIGVVHTDLKPDNIMFVNHKDQPFKLKLIDFGVAGRVSEVPIGTLMQPLSYRAPEVTLGLPLTDIWGVGCVMAIMYFGQNLFPGNSSYNCMRLMVHLLGQPENHVLSAGEYTSAYFSKTDDSSSPGWRLKSLQEYKEATGAQANVTNTIFDLAENLEDAVQKYRTLRDNIVYEDRMAFLSLLKSCLHLDHERRVTPRESLKNPFMSMVHLADMTDFRLYSEEARQYMTFSPLNHFDESEDFPCYFDIPIGSEGWSQLKEKKDSSCEQSDPQSIEADLEILPSLDNLSFLSNSSAVEGDVESSCDDNSDVEDCGSDDKDRCSDTESCISKDSLTDSLSGYDADIENDSNKSSDIKSNIDEDSDTADDDNIRVTRVRFIDTPIFFGEDDIQPDHSYPSGGDNLPRSWDGENTSPTEPTEPTEPSLYFDEAENRLSTPVFCGEDFPSLSSSSGYSEGEIFIFDHSPELSAISSCHDGVSEHSSLTYEEAGAAPDTTNVIPVADCGPSEDEVSTVADPTDGAAATNISPNNEAAAAAQPAVQRKKFRRIRKFFSRLRRRVVSLFKED